MTKPASISITLAAAAAAAAAFAGCWSSSKPGPTAQRGGVTVDLAAVTLAEDCGDDFAAPPPAASASQASMPKMAGDVAQGSCLEGSECGGGARACEQTSMQLAVRSTSDAPTIIRIKHVELVDESGKLVGRLEPRAPVVWASDGYRPWDQTVAAGTTLATSYALSAPPWHALDGGKWGAASKTFQLRVTLVIGDSDRTIDKVVAIAAPAMIEPPAVT
jgi:hypothetical protein